MATYTIIGRRHLRKYTAPALTPTYGVAGDVATMAANLCGCPWQAVGPKDACLPSHTEASLDANAAARDFFDAAAFCTEHADGLHRVCGQAACYVFELPDDAIGVALTEVVAHVVGDPYCAYGARIAVHTSADGTIPADCVTARTGLVHAEGVAPRTTAQNANGSYTWTGASADATMTPGTPITLQKYLMVVVALEQYTGRAGYAEGAAYIRNAVEISTSAAIAGWTDGATVDCTAASPVLHTIAEAGNYPRLVGEATGVYAAMRHLNGDAISFGPSPAVPNGCVAAGLNALYADLVKQRLDPIPATMLANGGARPGAGFTLRRRTSAPLPSDALGETVSAPRWELAVSVLCLPCIIPAGGKSIELDWVAPSPSDGVVRAWLSMGELDESPDAATLSAPALYTAAEKTVGGYALLASAPAAGGSLSAPIPAPPAAPTPATLIVAAYVPPESIALDSADVHLGVAALSADLPMGTIDGLDSLITPTVKVAIQ